MNDARKTDPRQIAERYIAAWNETDAERRTALLRQHWSADATYVDPMANARGVGDIGQLIGAVQQRFPGFRFALIGPVDGHGRHLRFSWSLGPAGMEPPIEGSDVVALAGGDDENDGRIESVVGFLDKLPQAA